MKAKLFFSKKVLSNFKPLSIMFLFIVVLFCCISSFCTAFASTDYQSFSNALTEKKETLVDRRIIIGLSNGLAKKNTDNSLQKKIGLRGAITSYGVGINSDDNSFRISSSTITPIESNLLSYIWTNNSEPNFLIQYVPLNRIITDISFDDEVNNIYVSKNLFLQLNSPPIINVYSYVLNDNISFNVIGYYDNEAVHRLSNVFYNVYQEPVFFNHTGFKNLYGGKEDYFCNIQTDIILSADSEYNDIVYNIFSEKNWGDSFVKYSLFKNVFLRMEELNSRSIKYNLLLGFIFVDLLIVLLVVYLSWLKELFMRSILLCNPYVLTCLWGLAIFLIFGLSKFIRTSLLFFEPSVGIILSFVVVFMIVQIIFHFYFKNKKELNNE